MVIRRRILEEPVSRLAVWALRVALFSLVATIVAIVVVRSGALDIVPALSTLAGALVLAVVAILLALGAGVVIWIDGARGGRQAGMALTIGLVLIAYPAYLGVKAYQLPAIYDVTTDAIDPPQFDVLARLRPRDANPVAYEGLYAAEQQRVAYADIEPYDTDSSPQESYNAALKVITRRKWRVVDAHPPEADLPSLVNAHPSGTATLRDGVIEAVARTPILGFRDDVVVRVRSTSDGTRIDVRSASRYGRLDFGTNAARVRKLLADIDTVLSAPAPAEPERKSVPKPVQPAGKGASARR